MRAVVIWFFLSCKRCLKKIFFLVVLLLLPIAALAFRRTESRENSQIVIAVCSLDTERNSLGRRLALALEEYSLDDSRMFRFQLMESPEKVIQEVETRRAECGYVIEEGLEQRLEENRYRRAIRLYYAPSTVVDRLSTETVFSVLAEICDRQFLTDYVRESGIFESVEISGQSGGVEEQAGLLYDQYLADNGVFHFVYEEEDGGQNTDDTENALSDISSLFPVRGLVAVYLFVTGLYGGVALCEDERKGVFLPLSSGTGLWCRLAGLAAPVILAAFSGLVALGASGALEGAVKELSAMTCYVVLVVVFTMALKYLVRTGEAICCLIPFFVVGSLVFCPVFVDVGQFVPGADMVGRLFLPGYYLRLF